VEKLGGKRPFSDRERGGTDENGGRLQKSRGKLCQTGGIQDESMCKTDQNWGSAGAPDLSKRGPFSMWRKISAREKRLRLSKMPQG